MPNYFALHSFKNTAGAIILYILGDSFIKLRLEKSKQSRRAKEPIYQLILTIVLLLIRYIKKVHLPCLIAQKILNILLRFCNIDYKENFEVSFSNLRFLEREILIYYGICVFLIGLIDLIKNVYNKANLKTNKHTSKIHNHNSCCGDHSTLEFKRSMFFRASIFIICPIAVYFYSINSPIWVLLLSFLIGLKICRSILTLIYCIYKRVYSTSNKFSEDKSHYTNLVAILFKDLRKDLYFIKELCYAYIYCRFLSWRELGRHRMMDLAPVLKIMLILEHDIKEHFEFANLLVQFLDSSKFKIKDNSIFVFLYKLTVTVVSEFVWHCFCDLLVLLKSYNFYVELAVSLYYLCLFIVLSPLKERKAITDYIFKYMLDLYPYDSQYKKVQDMGILDMEIQDMEIQDMEIQDMEIQDMGIQDMGIQDMEIQDMEIQDMELQDIDVQEPYFELKGEL